MIKVYNKLVRDRIPEIIEASGKHCKTAILSEEEYLKMLDAKLVAEAMYHGDAFAKEVYTKCAEYLGRGLSIIIDIINPEAIVIGSIYARNE